MECGTGQYRRLMEQYPLVTDAFLRLDEKYQVGSTWAVPRGYPRDYEVP